MFDRRSAAFIIYKGNTVPYSCKFGENGEIFPGIATFIFHTQKAF